MPGRRGRRIAFSLAPNVIKCTTAYAYLPWPNRDPAQILPRSGPGPGPLTVQRNGSAITVTARGSTASVIAANVMAAGAGVVHVVDAVLLPFYATLTQVCRGTRT